MGSSAGGGSLKNVVYSKTPIHRQDRMKRKDVAIGEIIWRRQHIEVLYNGGYSSLCVIIVFIEQGRE